MAGAVRVPRLALTQEEAQALAAAGVRVMQLYELELMPEKTLAWINLVGVLGTVYGTRIGAAVMEAGKRKAQKGPARVINMPGVQPQPGGDDQTIQGGA